MQSDSELFSLAEDIFHEKNGAIARLEHFRKGSLIVSVLIAAFLTPVVDFLLLPWTVPLRDIFAFTPETLIFLTFFLGLFFMFDLHYRKKAKHEILYQAAKVLSLQYRRAGVFPLVKIYDHHILPHYATRVIEEGFFGTYKKFNIAFQDFRLNAVRRYFDGTGYRSGAALKKMYGIAIRIELNKFLDHHTVLLPAAEQARLLAELPNQNLFFHDTVNMVYRSFTRKYAVLSTNQTEARYVLDPAVIERLIRLADEFDTDRIYMSFMNDEIAIVMLPGINLFEVGNLLRPVTVLTIERTLAQIRALRNIVGILELNPKAGLGATVSASIKT